MTCGSRRQQCHATTLPVLRQLIELLVGKRALELDVPREQRSRRSHERIARVVADSGERAEANELSGAVLIRSGTTDCRKVRIRRRQTHLRPAFDGRSVDAGVPGHILFVRPAVVEQVELDELDPLVFQIDERAVDAAQVLGRPERLRSSVGCAPVVRPVHPRHLTERDSSIAASTLRGVRLDFSQKTFAARIGNGPRSSDTVLPQLARSGVCSPSQEHDASGRATHNDSNAVERHPPAFPRNCGSGAPLAVSAGEGATTIGEACDHRRQQPVRGRGYRNAPGSCGQDVRCAQFPVRLLTRHRGHVFTLVTPSS